MMQFYFVFLLLHLSILIVFNHSMRETEKVSLVYFSFSSCSYSDSCRTFYERNRQSLVYLSFLHLLISIVVVHFMKDIEKVSLVYLSFSLFTYPASCRTFYE
jgi:hypothetical protein